MPKGEDYKDFQIVRSHAKMPLMVELGNKLDGTLTGEKISTITIPRSEARNSS